MKFCKNLQRVVGISDPEWAPYWTNYKMLKKLIKELPSLVPSEDHKHGEKTQTTTSQTRADSLGSVDSSVASESGAKQQHGDQTTEAKAAVATVGGGSDAAGDREHKIEQKQELGKSPGEIAFFKLLHVEFKKATYFFDRAQQEFQIREERVREGMEIMKQPNSIMVSEKWSMLAKSIFRLYKDLLLLETYAIMTFCSFSKILKKHDKVTGHHTRNAFMSNVVNNANFTNYPKVLKMIKGCEQLYEEVSERLVQEGKEALYEDERLFINMISRLNEQVLDTVDGEQKPDPASGAVRKEGRKEGRQLKQITFPARQQESAAMSTLRSMVEENDATAAAAQVSEGHIEVDDDPSHKRGADEADKKPAAKRTKQS